MSMGGSWAGPQFCYLAVLIRYHRVMAMNLRLTDEQDAALTALAEAQGLSKNEAAVRAILAAAARHVHQQKVRAYAREIIAEDAALLAQLADA
jgi:hypothetical protein